MAGGTGGSHGLSFFQALTKACISGVLLHIDFSCCYRQSQLLWSRLRSSARTCGQAAARRCWSPLDQRSGPCKRLLRHT